MSRTSERMAGDFVTVRLGDQLLGLPVLVIHDVLRPQRITPVPRAPEMVAGVMNLRGRIVTAIDMRARLGLPPRPADAPAPMCVVVESGGHPYALVVDGVGDVVAVPASAYDATPVTLSPRWRDVSNGVFRLDQGLLVTLDVEALLQDDTAVAA